MNYYIHAPAHPSQYPAGTLNSAEAYATNPGIGPTHAQGYAPYPMYAAANRQPNAGLFNERFLKGMLIGAAAAYILTNENVQRTAIKGAVKAWSLLQGGVEELKERFRDAEAEIRAESSE